MVAVGAARDPDQKVASSDDVRRAGVGAGDALPSEFVPVGHWAHVRREWKAWRAHCGRTMGNGWRGAVAFAVRPVARLIVRAAVNVGAASAESVLFPYCTSAADGSRRGSRSLRRKCRPRQQSHRQAVSGVAAVAPASCDLGAPVARPSAFEARVLQSGRAAPVRCSTLHSAAVFQGGTGERPETGARPREQRGGEKGEGGREGTAEVPGLCARSAA